MLLECTLIITLIFQFRKLVLSEKVPKLFALSVKYKAKKLVLAQVACLLAALVCTNHPPQTQYPSRSRCRLSTWQKISCSRRSLAFGCARLHKPPAASTAPKPFALTVRYKAKKLVLAQIACLRLPIPCRTPRHNGTFSGREFSESRSYCP